jgi:uncharacterized damage-inducible protein DinB
MTHRHLVPLVLLVLFGTCVSLLAQTRKPETPKDVAEILDRLVAGAEREFVAAAEALPADKYDFAPTSGEFKGVRTFGQQVKHVAAVNYMIGGAVLGEKPPVETNEEKGPEALKSKEEMVRFAKDSFAYLHKAVATINRENETNAISSPFGGGSATRLGMTASAVSHAMDHYGQMVEYLRMNGIIPPASRR